MNLYVIVAVLFVAYILVAGVAMHFVQKHDAKKEQEMRWNAHVDQALSIIK